MAAAGSGGTTPTAGSDTADARSTMSRERDDDTLEIAPEQPAQPEPEAAAAQASTPGPALTTDADPSATEQEPMPASSAAPATAHRPPLEPAPRRPRRTGARST